MSATFWLTVSALVGTAGGIVGALAVRAVLPPQRRPPRADRNRP